MERLQKIISKAGAASRREAERLILAGRVTLNGRVVTELGTQADGEQDVIAIDGASISAPKQKLYFLLNKPKRCISAVRDDRGRRTVIDLLPEVEEYIYPVGRLDYDTEGLLLLTNDGDLMNGLLHPRYEIEKTYIAKAQGVVTGEDIKKLCRGIMLEDGMTAPARAKLLERADNGSWCRVQLTIHEGRNRQVRRMLQAIGHRVHELKRVAFAGLTLEGVPRGGYRSLTGEEVARLKKIAGTAAGKPAGNARKES
ncbi:pseudouridine synthase [Anaerovibrio slackiae]|uniref:pseudouridine synthase n=1 Tax=Anaerovibrio slackiae TaxID=2652309 RepID=UPI003F164BFB